MRDIYNQDKSEIASRIVLSHNQKTDVKGDDEKQICELLTNLRHYCIEMNVDFSEMIQLSLTNFRKDVEHLSKNRTIRLQKFHPEKELVKLNNSCFYEDKEFSQMSDATKVFDHEVHFGNDMMMSIQVITCRNDSCYAQGVLFHNGNDIGCTEVMDSLSGEFTIDDYTVIVENITV